MLDQAVIEKLRERHSKLNALIFYRSCERAKTNGDLFDILETMPKSLPIVWSETDHRWKKVKDIYLSEDFFS